MARATLPSWYAVQTHYARENEALRELTNQGYFVYLPLFQLDANSKGVRLVKPLFEGYVFVEECPQYWRSINGTRGVQRLVLGTGMSPSLILGEDIAFFRACEDEFGYFVEPSCRVLRPGDRVSPRLGQFAGLLGTFVKMTAKSRCEILWTMMGRTLTTNHRLSELA